MLAKSSGQQDPKPWEGGLKGSDLAPDVLWGQPETGVLVPLILLKAAVMLLRSWHRVCAAVLTPAMQLANMGSTYCSCVAVW